MLAAKVMSRGLWLRAFITLFPFYRRPLRQIKGKAPLRGAAPEQLFGFPQSFPRS